MNKMILIVDDDINLCVMLQKWLVKNGYDAIYASSIEGAKKMIEEGHPNLLISDLRLPDGDGIMLLHWINDSKLALPVILMTGYGEVSIAVSAMKLGAKDFLEKPVVPSLLKEKIDNILNSIGGEKDREKSNNTKGRSQQKDYKREVTDMIIGKSPAFLMRAALLIWAQTLTLSTRAVPGIPTVISV